ncbi:hypothetical protein B0H19DRAFT_1383914 [Mycena capillaripes]|nr:hypothetical protein B0H19DRAFT_1383914 [Mycena capillaripes]
MFPMSGRDLQWAEYMVWMRPSTMQLCIELMAPAHDYLELGPIESGIRRSDVSFSQVPKDSHIMASISLQGYHEICFVHLAQQQYFAIFTNDSVQLGSVHHFPGLEYKNSFEIAFAPDVVVYDGGWETEDHMVDQMWNQLNGDEEGTSILENGWIRVNSANVVDEYSREVYTEVLSRLAWLAQANHIFDSLSIKSNLDNYVFLECIRCQLRLLGPIDNLPPGFLCLCPFTEFQTELPGHLRIPVCAAYWSRDPSGAERLSAEEAKNEGFPDIESRIWAFGSTWDDSVYTGIRQFHHAKGFDPWSQEVAIELGYRLYQVSCEQDDLFAHLQGSDTEDDYYDSDGDDDFSHFEDEQSESTAPIDTALSDEAEIHTHEREKIPLNLNDVRQTDMQYVLSPFSTPPINQLSGNTESAHNGWKRSYPAAFRHEEHGNSEELTTGQALPSKRVQIMSPGPLPREALSLVGDITASVASSSHITLDDLRFRNNVLQPMSPYSQLGRLDDPADPLHDLDAAEVDAVMILSQFGTRG